MISGIGKFLGGSRSNSPSGNKDNIEEQMSAGQSTDPPKPRALRVRKDPKSVTPQDVYTHMGEDKYEEKGTEEFSITGAKPADMGKHDIAETYTMLGITPEEFLEDHGGDSFDFAKVKLKFGDMCNDYANALNKGEPNMGVQFASIIIYTVGPQSRKIKAKTNDKVWVFRFPYKGTAKDTLKVKYNTVCVSTYKNDEISIKWI